MPGNNVKQGEVYWVFAKDLDVTGSEQRKSRPYVIVSRTQINAAQPNVVGVPLSTKLHKACAHRVLIPLSHMTKDVGCVRPMSDSVALVDHIRVLDISRFEMPRMAVLSETAIGGLELALAYVFDIR